MARFQQAVAPGGGGRIVTLGEKDNHAKEVVGVFLGSHMGSFQKPLYDFSGEDGETFAVSHNHELEKFLTPERVGQLMQITFDKLERTKKGNTVKRFRYLVANPASLTDEDYKRFPALQRSGDGTWEDVGEDEAQMVEPEEGDDTLPF